MDSVTATRGAVSSYNFLHLTFQEFFAAIHISTMSPAEQLEHFQQHHGGKLKVVLRFLAGINKLKCLMSETVRDTFVTSSDNDERGNYCLKCYAAVGVDIVNWMFEAQSSEVIASLKKIAFKGDSSMLPMDYYSLGYCVVHSNCDCVLDFECDDHHKEDSEMFVAGTSLRPDTSGRVVGLHASDTIDTSDRPGFIATVCVGLKDILYLHELSGVPSTQLNHIPWSDLSSLRVLGLLVVDTDTIMGLDASLSLELLCIYGGAEYKLLHHQDCVALCRAASTLKELRLHNITMNDTDVEVITEALVSNQTLETLDLDCALLYFTDTAADCLVQFITNSTTLQYLQVHLCRFNVPGLQLLVQALYNPAVQTGRNIYDLCVKLNDGQDISDLKEVFKVYPYMWYGVHGVYFSQVSNLQDQVVPLLAYKEEIDQVLEAYPDFVQSIYSVFSPPWCTLSSSLIE